MHCVDLGGRLLINKSNEYLVAEFGFDTAEIKVGKIRSLRIVAGIMFAIRHVRWE